MRFLLILVVVLSVALSAGCSAYRAPTITVIGAELTERSAEADVWAVELRMENANAEPLELLEFDYRFEVDGRTVYEGRRAAEATLSMRGTKTITLPAVVRYDRCSEAAARVLAGHRWSLRGSLLYVTPGEIAEVLLDTGVRTPSVGFAGDGRFPAEATTSQ